jgi:spermidine/putrescine ABC transporter ATP-binding subunit
MRMSDVRLHAVSKSYDRNVVVRGLDLEVKRGEFLTLLGPSGCGKTTTLRMIAGFVEPTEGRVYIAGEDVTDLPPQKRTVGMVFQDYALFPHLTVEENIAFGLVERGAKRDRIRARVRELLDLIRLPDIAPRYPAELSGGQQQRVALARAIAHPPRVLLMDEPLGALDLKMRETMQLELRRIQQELGITTVYVTHDQTEAMTMSDRIAVMSGGRIEQLASPEEIYRLPRTKFVAHFVGKVNFLPAMVAAHSTETSSVSTRVGVVMCSPCLSISPGTPVTLALRPENLQLFMSDVATTAMNVVTGTIESQVFSGNLVHVGVRLPDGDLLTVETRPGAAVWKRADQAKVAWQACDGVVIDEA